MPITKWSRRGARSAPLLLGFLGLAALLAGCAVDPESVFTTRQSALNPAGEVAREQLALFRTTLWWGIAVLAVVLAAIIYSMVRFRRRADSDGIPDQIEGALWLEFTWTFIPAIILVIIGIPTVRLIFNTERYVEATHADLRVNVIGHQWWWEFEYPDLGIVTANELHIPVGRRVILELDSADVLHSFWVPRLGGKRDLIPNQDNQLWLSADEAGLYYGHCAELCLTAHAYMRFRVVADTDEEFASWVAAFRNEGETQLAFQETGTDARAGVTSVSANTTGAMSETMTETVLETVDASEAAPVTGYTVQSGPVPPAVNPVADPTAGLNLDPQTVETGRALFKTKGCAGCHAVRGYAQGQIGPDLTNFGLRTSIAAGVLENTPENMAAWLRNPEAVKPGNYMPILWTADDPNADEEITALVAYLESLGHGEAATASAASDSVAGSVAASLGGNSGNR